MRPAKSRISLVRVWWSHVPSTGYPKRDKRELLPYWVDVQAGLNICWSQRSYWKYILSWAGSFGFSYGRTVIVVTVASKTYIDLLLSLNKSLRKHAYSNIQKISPPKNEKFQTTNSDFFFHISAQNINCGYSLEPPRRGGSNKYPQSMFLSRNKEK